MKRKLHQLIVTFICLTATLQSFANTPSAKKAENKKKSVSKAKKKEEPYVKFQRAYKGIVEAYNLNLRIKPSTLYTAVGRASDGDKLEVIGKKGAWLQIKAPENVEVWVSKKFVKDGKITTKVNLRGGPSINHQVYAQAPKGMPVSVVNDKRSDWVQIKPPPNIYVWASGSYISFSASDKREMANETAIVKNKVSKKIIPLDYMSIPPEKITTTGVIGVITENQFGLKYALCDAKNRNSIIAYLKIDSAKGKKFFEKVAIVSGTRRWVKGWTTPIIEVNSLKEKKK
ncbi:SH3 domain-containing protein [Lentisphaerota bacterium WC36G]|nr:SH3 domain-containing protein [Lentisphaerae bacterium WC36]